MTQVRIALANLPYPPTPNEAVANVVQAIGDAAASGAAIVCFPECYVPGYRGLGHVPPPPNPTYLAAAWAAIAAAAGQHGIAAVVGTERVVNGALRATALVVTGDGQIAGFQDKVQLDPTEDDIYAPGIDRRVFDVGPLRFGVVICHEGWRYPETVRAAARQGAHVVFHPHYTPAFPDAYRPTTFADPANTFHEKAALCRAAENTCYFATVNYASEGSGTTSAVARPDGTLLVWQPYGEAGLLVCELDLDAATGLLAQRCRQVHIVSAASPQ